MTKIQETGDKVLANVERVIVGKHHEVRLALVALLCRGHLLIEDVPGTGKTVLAKAIEHLHQRHTRLVFSSVLGPVRKQLDRYGVSADGYYETPGEALEAFHGERLRCQVHGRDPG